MPRRPWSRVLAVILITLSAIYLVKLGSHALATRRAAVTADGLATDVAQKRSELEALETALPAAGSPEQIERWAREQQNWSLPGDHPIVLVTAAPTATATPAPPVATPGPSNWRRLVEWISGGR